MVGNIPTTILHQDHLNSIYHLPSVLMLTKCSIALFSYHLAMVFLHGLCYLRFPSFHSCTPRFFIFILLFLYEFVFLCIHMLLFPTILGNPALFLLLDLIIDSYFYNSKFFLLMFLPGFSMPSLALVSCSWSCLSNKVAVFVGCLLFLI